jgi:hypothetical protein
MLSIKLFRLVFYLFRLNRNIETLCLGIEPKQTVAKLPKQTETNRNNPKISKKYQNMLSIKLFWLLFCLLVQSKSRNSLFRFRSETTETNVLFSDSAETSFSSNFSCFESKLVSKDTLCTILHGMTKNLCLGSRDCTQ